MAEPSDFDLLHAFARGGAQAAFAELVQRYVGLVYSAARRQVSSTHLAEEVTQSVFLDLARQAATLSPDQPLGAWLHVVTRRTAIDVVRRETRRQACERAAAQELGFAETAMRTNDPEWRDLEPLLDEAVAALPVTDRSAIVLRYFQNKSLREVGAALGISDDAAQKRVSRALEALRTRLVRRGVAVTAAGLATNLSAHAVGLAPAGLGAAITSSVAAAGVATSTVLATARLVGMTTLQKSAIVAALALTGAAGWYEANLIARQGAELTALRADADRARRELRDAAHAGDEASARLKGVEQQIDRVLATDPAGSPEDSALEAQMREWLGQVEKIKELLARNPALDIPELKLLSDQDWFSIAAEKRFNNDDEVRAATAQARHRAENMAVGRIFKALQAYLRSHDGMLPNTPAELATFADPPLDPAILDRYELLQTGKASDAANRRGDGQVLRGTVMASKAPADVEHDVYWSIGVNGYGNSGSALSFDIRQAQQTFAHANGGQPATSALQLAPYLKWGEDTALVQKQLEEDARPGSP